MAKKIKPSQVDAALARPLSPDLLAAPIIGTGNIRGTALPEISLGVKKSGRSTGLTTGRITNIGATVTVGFGGGRQARFTNQIVSTSMGKPGDSGSLLLTGSGHAVGLLFAGSMKTTLFHPIEHVLSLLEIQLSEDGPLPAQASEERTTSWLSELCESKADELLSFANVVGVGIGHKITEGKDTGQICLTILVERKLRPELLRREDRLPAVIDGLKTDVVESGPLTADTSGWHGNPQDRKEKLRPARPGMSIAHYRVSAGTFGAVVYDIHSGEPLILSNNHVLANGTNGEDGLATVGDPILQPGPRDGGQEPDDVIATLLRFHPLRFL
jgi:hypothetical protein